jgi:hypothetical protein
MLRIENASVALAICADITQPYHAATAKKRGADVYAAGVLITENGYEADTAFLQYSLQHWMVVLMAQTVMLFRTGYLAKTRETPVTGGSCSISRK